MAQHCSRKSLRRAKPATDLEIAVVKLARIITGFDDLVLKATLVICGSLLLVMVVIQGAGVVFRFVLHDSLSWSDEISSYLFVWLTCLGAAAGVKLRVHPEVKALADRLPAFTQGVLRDTTDLAIIGLGIVFVVYGGDMLALMGTETASSLPISMVYPYLAIPVGGVLLIAHSVVRIVVSRLSPNSAVAAPVGVVEISSHI
jgi:TRAP-type C4-dicarboxylate transport system permease small subunit